jgi:hypothetical protein
MLFCCESFEKSYFCFTFLFYNLSEGGMGCSVESAFGNALRFCLLTLVIEGPEFVPIEIIVNGQGILNFVG